MSSSATSRLALLLSSKKTRNTLKDLSDRASLEAGDSDEALITRISNGDQEALADLFRRYARLVRGVAYRVLRDDSEADDLLQDVFLSVYGKCGMFDSSKGNARSWIVQITYRRAIDRRRRLTSRHFYTQVALDSEAPDFLDLRMKVDRYEQSLEGVLGKKALKHMFKVLSENQRETLRLFFFEGCAFDEIALKTGQSIGNVRNHYYRGLDKLRGVFTGKD